MNFKKTSFSAVVAATMAIGTLAIASPAEALNLSFTGGAKFDKATGQFNFYDTFLPDVYGDGGQAFVTPTTDASLAPLGSIINLKDLQLTTTGTIRTLVSTNPVGSFITGLGGGTTTFELTAFNFNTETQKAIISGYFNPGGVGFGGLTTQELVFTSGTSYSVQIVPTPALLPGLIGMGVAAIRKKRKDEESEVTPESAEARA